MKVSLPFGSLLTVVTLTVSLLTACGRSPLVRPETSASETEIAAETGEAISPVLPATKPPETSTSTPSLTAIVQTSLVSEADVSPSSEPFTPTPRPLSPLNKNAQVIIFTANSKNGPQIYRVQVDEKGQKAGPVEQISYSADFRMRMPDLFPSPDGKYIAIESGGESGPAGLKILDVATGRLTPLLGEQPKMDQRAYFLDWSPDGQTLLVLGVVGSDLQGSAWLVDINTRVYHDVNIKQTDVYYPEINAASFSLDETAIVYAQRNCGQCNSQLWQITLDNSAPHLLFEASAEIRDVWWTKDNEYIVFIQWPIMTGYPWDEFTVGELYMIKADGSQPRSLSPLVMHIDNQPFLPAWSPDGRQIAFVKSSNSPSEKRLDQLSSNIYVANILTGQVRQATHLSDSQVIRPTWSPDGSRISFLVGEVGTTIPFQTQMVTVDDSGKIQQLDIEEALIEATASLTTTAVPQLDSHSILIWLP